jgi:hypothetical protein
VGKSDEYRRYANECLELASTLRSLEAQAVLLHMAEVWSRLADREKTPVVAAGDDESGYRGH